MHRRRYSLVFQGGAKLFSLHGYVETPFWLKIGGLALPQVLIRANYGLNRVWLIRVILSTRS